MRFPIFMSFSEIANLFWGLFWSVFKISWYIPSCVIFFWFVVRILSVCWWLFYMILQWFCVLVQLDLIFMQARFWKDPPAFLLDFYIFSVCRNLRKTTEHVLENNHLILGMQINEKMLEKTVIIWKTIDDNRMSKKKKCLLPVFLDFLWF